MMKSQRTIKNDDNILSGKHLCLPKILHQSKVISEVDWKLWLGGLKNVTGSVWIEDTAENLMAIQWVVQWLGGYVMEDCDCQQKSRATNAAENIYFQCSITRKRVKILNRLKNNNMHLNTIVGMSATRGNTREGSWGGKYSLVLTAEEHTIQCWQRCEQPVNTDRQNVLLTYLLA